MTEYYGNNRDYSSGRSRGDTVDRYDRGGDRYIREDRRGSDRRGGDRRGPDRGPRPPRITEPTSINIMTNMYKYVGKDLCLYQYTVTITPEVKNQYMYEKFVKICEANKFDEPVAFDGLNTLVSDRKFEDLSLAIPMREGEMVMKIEFRNCYKMSDLKGEDVNDENTAGIIQCMDILTKNFQKSQFFVDKRKMVKPNTKPFDLGMGLEIIPGLSASFRFNNDGFFMNLDPVFCVFHKPQSLLDLISEFQRSNQRYSSGDVLTPEMHSHLDKFIKKLKLRTTHRGEKNKTFAAFGLADENADEKIIEFEDKSTISVSEYFQKNYSPLKHPKLPLVIFRVRDKQEIYMPIEVLEIVPMQKYSPRLNDSMTASMIRIAAKRPTDRFRMIEEKAQELKALSNPELEKFGIVFDNTMLNCKGLILPAPKIQFDQKTVEVNNGSWNLRDVQALKNSEIADWKIFVFRSRDKIRPDLIDSFVSLASRYNMSFPKNPPEQVVVSTVEQFYNASKAKLNLVILPDRSSLRYDDIKRVSETYTGNYTQCLLGSNIVKLGNPAFVGNLLLKVNAKLGGQNFTSATPIFDDKKTLLVGVDVTHPSAEEIDNPTIVSVVSSLDYSFVNYKTQIAAQEARSEIIEDLKSIVVNLLRAHFSETGSKPERIVVFRDGVGDSMFATVFNQEIEYFKEACSSIEKGYSPELNFIVAQKRHSVRFAVDGQNLVPGTFIDDICQRDGSNLFDFFLVSAHALQGTARPTRYKVILNESGFSKEQLYENVYNLCHTYARATKSVSVVPPIYYAHLAAARGKAYLERDESDKVVLREAFPEMTESLYYL